MGGLILDNVVIYLTLAIIRGVWRLRSRNWPIVKGTVSSTSLSKWLYYCPVIKYRYSVDGSDFAGSFRRGYWFDPSEARFLAAQFRDLKTIAVRYNPASPSQSYLREEDQDFRRSNKRSN